MALNILALMSQVIGFNLVF